MSDSFPQAYSDGLAEPHGPGVSSLCGATRQWLATGELSAGPIVPLRLVSPPAGWVTANLPTADTAPLETARQHLAECEACQRWREDQRVFDNRVRELLHETPVPAGGPERLLRQLQLRDRALGLPRPEVAETSLPETAEAQSLELAPPWSGSPGESQPPPGSRERPVVKERTSGGTGPLDLSLTPPTASASVRAFTAQSFERTAPTRSVGQPGRARVNRRRWGAASLVALLLVAGWWAWTPPQVPWQAVLARLAELDWRAPGLRPFTHWSAAATPQLPVEMETVQIQSAPFSLPVERVEVAVFFFESRRPGSKRVEAALAVLPVEQLAGGHRLGGFLATPPATAPGLCATSWVEGRLAFVCCVRGTSSDLLRLARPKPAA